MCISEPHEGLLSAAARGHVRRESEGRSGSDCSDGDQQRQPQRQQSSDSLPALALPPAVCYATGVKSSRVCLHQLPPMSISYNVLLFPQTQRVHRMRVTHSPAVLAAAGLSYPQCFAPGLLMLYAHSTGRWISYCRPSDRHPDRIPRTIQGRIAEPFCSDELQRRDSDDALLCVCRRQCCTCVRCSTPSCSPSCGPSTASRPRPSRPIRTRTRTSSARSPS